MDVDGAYLNTPLKEKIYMRQAKEGHVCLLKCAVYGLRQAGCKWNEILCQIMSKLGLRRCHVEHTVFYKHNGPDSLIVAADVDNMMITGNSRDVIHKFKEGLA
jgi:hypothetical protein